MDSVNWGEDALVEEEEVERFVDWETDELLTDIEVAFDDNEVDKGTVENGETLAVDGCPVTFVSFKGAWLLTEDSVSDSSVYLTATWEFFVDDNRDCWLTVNEISDDNYDCYFT